MVLVLAKNGGKNVYDDGTAETVFVLTANNVQEGIAWNNV